MKKSNLYLALFFAIILVFSCSKNDNGSNKVSGTIEYTTTGNHEFQIDAKNITATITIIAAGGGGGGGVGSSGLSNSTGGGGGGGAGEAKTWENISLESNTLYTAVVGTNGLGGTINNNGTHGSKSSLKLGATSLYETSAGNGGRSNTIGENVGGNGGAGFPAGEKGGDGEFLDITWSGPAGEGGAGGNNGTNYGTGGAGGIGTAFNNATPIAGTNGLNGKDGYIKIEWAGEE